MFLFFESNDGWVYTNITTKTFRKSSVSTLPLITTCGWSSVCMQEKSLLVNAHTQTHRVKEWERKRQTSTHEQVPTYDFIKYFKRKHSCAPKYRHIGHCKNQLTGPSYQPRQGARDKGAARHHTHRSAQRKGEERKCSRGREGWIRDERWNRKNSTPMSEVIKVSDEESWGNEENQKFERQIWETDKMWGSKVKKKCQVFWKRLIVREGKVCE